MYSTVPPKYVRQVLIKLQTRGYSSYLVGGCVRDMFLGRHPQDWDICTGALPNEVLELFPGSRPTGIAHGTVTVIVSGKNVEVTTFRSDGSYSDHRHPDSVNFVGDLNEDLSRRDFTMNAMAISADGVLSDPFDGHADIENKLIRCVGVPEMRFEEDALRMFRAIRFSARLGFTVEEKTLAAIRSKAHLASGLAPERVRSEVEKILLSPSPETMFTLISHGLLDSYLKRHLKSAEELYRMRYMPKKALLRWCAFCQALIDSGCIDSVSAFLEDLRLDNRTVRCCADCCAILAMPAPKSSVEWKKQLKVYGTDTVTCSARCRDTLYGGSSYKALRAIIKSGECYSIKHLAVTGDDLLSLGLKGRDLGDMLNFLLDYVMEFPMNNKRELLMSLAQFTEE